MITAPSKKYVMNIFPEYNSFDTINIFPDDILLFGITSRLGTLAERSEGK